MLSPTARLISYRAMTGQDGNGEPVFESNRLAYPVNCELKDPGSYLADQYASRGARLDTRVLVNRHVFVVAGRMPEPGDRLTVKADALMSVDRTGDVLNEIDLGGGSLIELHLGQRADGGAS